MNVLLLVTEEPAIYESLKAALVNRELLLCEQTVQDAMRRLVSITPDVIIIDDSHALGIKALENMKDGGVKIPFMVLSSRGDTETISGLTLAGACSYVTKPFACDDLRNAVAKAMTYKGHYAQPEISPINSENGKAALGQHKTALRWISRTSSTSDDPICLAEGAVEAAMEIFGVVRASILLEGDDLVRVIASSGISASITGPLRLSYTSGLMRWFEENMCVCNRATGLIPPEAIKEMQLLGARVAAPIICRGIVCGAILIGEKATGGQYSHEEIERDLDEMLKPSRYEAVMKQFEDKFPRFYHVVSRFLPEY